MSESSTESPAAPEPTKVETTGPVKVEAKTAPPETDGKDWQAEADKWKALSRKNEEAAKANAEAAKRLAQIEEANASDLEKAIKKAREEGASEVTARANARLLTAEARALAAEARFRNPNLAVKALDLSGVTVDDDGTVDTAAVKRLLDDLAKDNPYLVDDGKPARPKPDDSQGAKPGASASTATPGLGRLREAYAQISNK